MNIFQRFRNSRTPELPNSRNPEIPNSGNPEFPNSGNPEFLNSGNPEIPNSGTPELLNSRDPEFPNSGIPEIPNSGNPEILNSRDSLIPPEDRPFFALLRIGLWQKITPRDSEILRSGDPIDWNYIYKLSCEQTVQGIVADGIEIAIANGLLTVEDSRDSEIPKSGNPGLRPSGNPEIPKSGDPSSSSSGNPEIPRFGDPIAVPQAIYDKFLAMTASIIQRNLKVNALQAKICQVFNDPSCLYDVFPNAKSSGNPSIPNSGNSDLPNSVPPSGDSEIRNSLDSLPSGNPTLPSGNPEIPKSGIPSPSGDPITYVVMKGQSAAQYYPKPLLRVSGDIDFFLDDENYERAKRILDSISDCPGTQNKELKHFSSSFGDLTIELHSEEMSGIGKQKIFKQLKDEMLHKGDFRSYDCNGVEVTLAPAAFDVSYIFLHFIKHYYTSGINLRQIVDWVMALNSTKECLDIHQYINRLNLSYQWDRFSEFAFSFIGSMPSNSKLAQNDIWEVCKLYGDKQSRQPEVVAQSLFSTIANVKRQFNKQWNLSPSFAIINLFSICYNSFRKRFANKTLHGAFHP